MKDTSQEFDNVSLHDAKIVSITRDGDSITLRLSFAALLKGHPCNHIATDHLICVEPTLAFLHVRRDESRTWSDDAKRWDEHRHPDRPLDDDIMESKYDVDHFFLDGFHHDGWSEWRIWADGFRLQWQEDHPYHNEPKKGQPDHAH